MLEVMSKHITERTTYKRREQLPGEKRSSDIIKFGPMDDDFIIIKTSHSESGIAVSAIGDTANLSQTSPCTWALEKDGAGILIRVALVRSTLDGQAQAPYHLIDVDYSQEISSC